MSLLAKICLSLMVTGLLLTGCGSTPQPPESASRQAPEEFRLWQEVRTVSIESGTKREQVRGYVSHHYSSREMDEGLHFVHDNKFKALGFVTPSGKSYAFAKEGDPTLISIGGLNSAIPKLLEFQSTFTLEKMR